MLAKILVSANQGLLKEQLLQQLLTLGIKNPHPDLIYFSAGEKLGVQEAKLIRNHLSLKPVKGKIKGVAVEQAADLTPEAQNSLLKTLEEPVQDALIILGVPNEDKLLPTITSRCEIIHLPQPFTTADPSFQPEIAKLLGQSIEQRFAFIEKLEDKDSFLQALCLYFQDPQNLALHIGGVNEHGSFLEELLQAQIWANQSVNIRAILEYLMLQLPSKI